MVQFRSFSRSKKFFEMFSEAARNVHQGAKALDQMLHDFRGSADQWRAVEEYEHEGDKITHRIIQTLHQSSMTPGDREDIHKLAATLDDVLDLIEGAAFRMAMYKVAQPTPDAIRLAAVIVRCHRTDRSRSLRAAGRRPYPAALHRDQPLGERGGRDLARAIAALFTREAAPLDVIKWKEIYETMETATDRGEDVANLLEEIVLKRS